MRFASLSRDYWELDSAEARHAENPATFWIPEESIRRSLRVGQAAKLLFDIEIEEQPGRVVLQCERMWVIVSEVGANYYIGILDSKPASYEPADNIYLRFGAEVPFGPEHVADFGEPPAEYSEWQLRQPPEVLWPGRNGPGRNGPGRNAALDAENGIPPSEDIEVAVGKMSDSERSHSAWHSLESTWHNLNHPELQAEARAARRGERWAAARREWQRGSRIAYAAKLLSAAAGVCLLIAAFLYAII